MQKNDWKLGKVVLNVADLEKMSAFYEEMMGMDVLEKQNDSVTLGVAESKEALVELVNVQPGRRKATTGLFHLAVLLPSRSDLGEFLYHLLVKRFNVQGASDHGYSEAIYFNDPEGNGIEVYADKPQSEWDIREDGRIEGITIAMDAEGVIGSVKKAFEGLPAGTIMGHVHLTVRDVIEAKNFYEGVLGLGLKSEYFGQANFYASGDYHHHIGSNSWAGKQLPPAEENQLGLAYFTWELPNQAEKEALLGRLNEQNWEYQEANGIIIVKDDSGIEQRFLVKEAR